MKRFVLLYNPIAGDAYFKYKLDEFIERFQRRGCVIIPFKLLERIDTARFVNFAQEIGADGIIAAGGDGTLHSVINAMFTMDVDLPLGIIPSGTSNDFATFLKLGSDLEKCIEIIANGQIRAVDVGQVNGERYFINVASAGLLTGVAHSADTMLKNTLGKVAYYLKGIEELPSFRPLKMRINADGAIIEDEIFLFLIANSGTVGSFRALAPNAQINDGKLDLLVASKCRLPELMRMFISLLTGTHINHKSVRYIQAKTITIECAEELVSDLDGELGPQLPLCVTALSNKLRIFTTAEGK
ncbi:Diacylglycerol kinase [bioreactor metagenome]|uniref:Diacylglycerol kinase n=1 Tax=bioreactor metagenome TaxID=1076179 RepID=A0A644UE41_9ZZZZ